MTDITAGIPVGLEGCSRSRMVTETEITVLASIAGAITPNHTDRTFAASTVFGDITLGGPFIVAYVIGLWRTNPLNQCLRDDYGVETITGLGHEVRYRSPVLSGDTLWAETTLTNVRKSATDPTHGILTFHDVAHSQRADVVLELDRHMLFRRRPHQADSNRSRSSSAD